jgi:2-polyprenyl-6-methoxyphenol hydroxylase-like FAD-dependent oxidoreductase
MSAKKTVQIVGGGLAGLTLGIALRREKVPVTIFEAGTYPRHRVCGEFISGRGQQTLARLGLRECLENAGAIPAVTAAFFTGTKASAPRPLPAGAICLSRYMLDALLADEFQNLGGELVCGQRRRDEDFREGFVRASGRRLHAGENGARWFGLKIHARNVLLGADLEMHVSSHGYVGLCKLSGGEINVCGLFRRTAGETVAAQNVREWLRGLPDSILRERLGAAAFDEKSFCSVAGISLRPQRAGDRREVCIGDAITMIPPVTGNGMSMAFESAELAALPLVAWSRGEMPWAEARKRIARDCDERFSRRLALASWLQRFLLTPALQNPLLSLVSRSDLLWRMAFERTR